MASLMEISQMLQAFSGARDTLKRANTPMGIVERTEGELNEIKEELLKEEIDPQKLAAEIADAMIYLFTLSGDFGFDMELEIKEKIALNTIRFPANKFKDGDYEESRRECKAAEKPIIEEFYQIPR